MRTGYYLAPILAATAGVGMLAWIHGQTRARPGAHEIRAAALAEVIPSATTAGAPTAASGDPAADAPAAPSAMQPDLDRANERVLEAQARVKQIEEALQEEGEQLRAMRVRQEMAEREQAEDQRTSDFEDLRTRLGLVSPTDSASAAATRQLAQADLASLRSGIAAGSVEMDLRRAELVVARAALAKALARQDAAESNAGPTRAREFGMPGVTTGPNGMYATVEAPLADVADIEVGQRAIVTLDGVPGAWGATVMAIGETPVEGSARPFCSVILSLENPGEAVGVNRRVHALLQPRPR